jgi:hypothetical protein
MENRLFLSTDNYGAAWLWRPGVLVILALTVAGIVYPLLRRRKRAAAPSPAQQSKAGNVALLAALAVAVAWALWESRAFGFRAGLFPWVIGTPLLAIALVQLALALRRPAAPAQPGFAAEMRQTRAAAGWIAGYLVVIWLLGFTLAVPLAILLYLRLGARESWPLALLLSAAGAAVFYGLFQLALRIPFPPGLLTGV